MISAIKKETTPVTKITIVPHTEGALGYTLYLPEEEKFLTTKDEMLTKICSLLGGRAAEQVVFGTMTTGAANDLQMATSMAKNMVALYGMSDALGLMAPAVIHNQYLDGSAQMDCSDETASLVDKEVRNILNACYADTRELLAANRGLLDEISEYLLTKETITGDELMAFVNADQTSKTQAADTEDFVSEDE